MKIFSNETLLGSSQHYLTSNGTSNTHDVCHIKKIADDYNFNVKIKDLTEKIGIFTLPGPYSREIENEDFSDENFRFRSNKIIKIRDLNGKIHEV